MLKRASRHRSGFNDATPPTASLDSSSFPPDLPGGAPRSPYGGTPFPTAPAPIPRRRRGCLWLGLVALLAISTLAWGYLASLTEPTAEPQARTTPPRPTVTPIAGWHKFTAAKQVELWLPEAFVGGDPQRDWPGILKDMRAAGEAEAATADQIETALIKPNRKRAVLLMFNTSEEHFGQNVLVGHGASGKDSGEVAAAVLQGIFDANAGQFDVEVRENEPAHLAGYDAHRLQLVMDDAGLQTCQTTYILTDGREFWAVTFTYALEAEPRMREVIDDSMKSFTLLSP